MNIAGKIRAYIRDSLLFGNDGHISEDSSLLEAGVIDSTGAMELVTFLESEFGITIEDRDLIPDNLDSISAMHAFVVRKQEGAQAVSGAASAAGT